MNEPPYRYPALSRPNPPSWSDRFRGAMLGGAVGDALGAGVRTASTGSLQQWFGPHGVTDYLRTFGRRGGATELTQLTVFTLESLLHAKAVEAAPTHDRVPTDFVRMNHLRWLHTQGVPWEYAMQWYLNAYPEPSGWLQGRPELFSTRNPTSTALLGMGRLATIPPDAVGHELPLHSSSLIEAVVWAAPAMVWGTGPDAAFLAGSGVGGLLTADGNIHGASGLHADVLAQLTRGVPLWDAVSAAETHRLPRIGPAVEVNRTLHAAMFAAQRGVRPTPAALDVEFDIRDKPGELGIALTSVATSADFAEAVLTAVNHSADSSVTGALAGQLAGAIHGADAIPRQWLEELELREVVETLCADAAEAFAPPPPPPPLPRWAQRYVTDPRSSFSGPLELERPTSTETTVVDTQPLGIDEERAERRGSVEQEMGPPTEVLPVIDAIAEETPGRASVEPGTAGADVAYPPFAPEQPEFLDRGEVPGQAEAADESFRPAPGESPFSSPASSSSPTVPGAPSWETPEPAVPAEDGQPPEVASAPAEPQGPDEHQGADEHQGPDEHQGADEQWGPVEPQGVVDLTVPPEPADPVAEPDPSERESGEPVRTRIDMPVPEPEPEEVEPSPAPRPRRGPARLWPDGEVGGGVDEPTSAGTEPVGPVHRDVSDAGAPGGDIVGERAPESERREPVTGFVPPDDAEPPREAGPGAPTSRTEVTGSADDGTAEAPEAVGVESTAPVADAPVADAPVGGEQDAAGPADDGTRAAPSSAQPQRQGGDHAVPEDVDAVAPSLTERVLGCFLGGALGDALGADLEFVTAEEITERFGPRGPSGLREAYGVHGAITDDTQMTLFTAEGLIRASIARRALGHEDPVPEVQLAYQRWLHTQGVEWDAAVGPLRDVSPQPDGWLICVPALFSTRAPGKTVFRALDRYGRGHAQGSPDEPVNDSKGCGGVMRAAPAALWSSDPAEVFDLAARTAALTHGHPSGYLSAGAFAVIVQQAVLGRGLDDGVWLALQVLETWEGHEETSNALAMAVDLAAGGVPAPERIAETLGGGWVGEQALAIAVCATLAAGDDVELALRTAVHHSGDSDSTGAICGNIIGALVGIAGLPVDWLADLELRDVVEQAAMDCVVEFDRRPHPDSGTASPQAPAHPQVDDDWHERYPVGAVALQESPPARQDGAVTYQERPPAHQDGAVAHESPTRLLPAVTSSGRVDSGAEPDPAGDAEATEATEATEADGSIEAHGDSTGDSAEPDVGTRTGAFAGARSAAAPEMFDPESRQPKPAPRRINPAPHRSNEPVFADESDTEAGPWPHGAGPETPVATGNDGVTTDDGGVATDDGGTDGEHDRTVLDHQGR